MEENIIKLDIKPRHGFFGIRKVYLKLNKKNIEINYWILHKNKEILGLKYLCAKEEEEEYYKEEIINCVLRDYYKKQIKIY